MDKKVAKEIAKESENPFPLDSIVIVETVGNTRYAVYKQNHISEKRYEISEVDDEEKMPDGEYLGELFEYDYIAANNAKSDGTLSSLPPDEMVKFKTN